MFWGSFLKRHSSLQRKVVAGSLAAAFSAGTFSSYTVAMEKNIDNQLLVEQNKIKDDEEELNELKKDIKKEDLADLPKAIDTDKAGDYQMKVQIDDVAILNEVDSAAKEKFLNFINSEKKDSWFVKTNWELIEEIFGEKNLCEFFCEAYKDVSGTFIGDVWIENCSRPQLEKNYSKFQDWFKEKFGRKMSKMDLIFALHKTYGDSILTGFKNSPSACLGYIRKAIKCIGFNYEINCAKVESYKENIEKGNNVEKLVKGKLFSHKAVALIVIISIIAVVSIIALIIYFTKTAGPESNKEKAKTKNQPGEYKQGESNENLEPKQSFCISSTPGEIGVGTVFKALGVSCCLGAKCVGEKISNGNKSGKAKIKDNNGKERSKLLTGNSY